MRSIYLETICVITAGGHPVAPAEVTEMPYA